MKCELLPRKEETLTLPGCSTWVLGNAGATGYYRVGYQPDAVTALAADAETKLSQAERIALEFDIWASVRVGREPIGDYLAFTEGVQSDRNRTILEDVLGRLDYIGLYLVNDNDRDTYRAWLRQYLDPIVKDVGWEPKPGESDEQKSLRSQLLNALGFDARDPGALAQARKIADKTLDDPASGDWELARGAFRLAALNGDEAFYDRLMSALKNPKSPEEYYVYFLALAQFGNQKLLQRTLDYAISPDVRSQDGLFLITNVMANPVGETLAWDFIQSHWDVVEKTGGPFAGTEVMNATSKFCDAKMRDRVTSFFVAHKVEAAARSYKQSIESINNCVDLKIATGSAASLMAWQAQQGCGEMTA